MKTCGIRWWLLVVLITCLGQVVLAKRPNVVFLLSDDQGWTDYGFMGHPHLSTPNLDELANAGILYDRGYVTAPLCRPSLASIVTGLYPHQTQIRGNDPCLPAGIGRRTEEGKKKRAELSQQMTASMEHHPSFIQLLREHGYATLQTGKWWEGNPLDHGFTDAMTHGDPTRGGRHGDVGLKIGRETMQPIYDFIEKAQQNEQPFFVWYGVFLPHSPHNAPARLYDKYKDVAPDESTARYWANVEWFDEGCGQIVEYLKKEALYENTIFVYTCDNGWVPDPAKTGRSVRSKRQPVEAGIRTPMFLTHGATLEPQRHTEILASNIDIATTILRACDIEPPSVMQGLDLSHPEQLKKRNRVFVDVYEHDSDVQQLDNLENGLVAHVVIDGWDKLISRPDRNELFDLKTDADDRHDVAQEFGDKVTRLSGILDDWVEGKTASSR